ncbi:LPS assembly lipoprotein LptE [Salinisphaera sp. SPP-AMP-43]|uniref:LPS-assembly lipoprotein LptE n=1 Tax=Salinisphaera sp. SPP-AMP-43 TaxID=3121288 RepID=UPI003C6DDA3D
MNGTAVFNTAPRSALRAVCALFFAVALAGCGFHMQGATPLPQGIDAMHVAYHNDYRVGDPPVVSALKQRLRRQHLLGSIDAAAQLEIASIQTSQRVVSVSPVNGDAAEVAITTRVVFNYSVNDADQLSGETLSATRNFSIDDTQRLSSEEQRNRLLSDMQQNLANLILERVAQSNRKLAGGSDAGS